MNGEDDNNRTWKLDETSEDWKGFKKRSQNTQKQAEKMSMTRLIDTRSCSANGSYIHTESKLHYNKFFILKNAIPLGFTSSIKCMKYF